MVVRFAILMLSVPTTTNIVSSNLFIDWLLFNATSQFVSNIVEIKLFFNVLMMMSALYYTIKLS
jgi:hypothetical protein